MKEENDILAKAAHRDGLTVSDGYFADFAARMEAALPVRDELESPRIAPKRSLWQSIRPYAYKAAMFLGVWCMFKMFTLMAGADKDINFDNAPILAEAASNEEIVEEFVIDSISQFDVYESWMDNAADSAFFASLPIDSAAVY